MRRASGKTDRRERHPVHAAARSVRVLVAALLAATTAAGCVPPAPEKSPAETAIEKAFSQHGETVVTEAKRVAWCESRWQPDVRNGQYLGLFQLGAYHWWRFDGPWYDPEVNAAAAQSLYTEQGWTPWTCKP